MAFPKDGSNHHNAIKSEKNLIYFISQLEIIYNKKIKQFIHKGGTKMKSDCKIIFEDGTSKDISLKFKKDIKKGSFDWTNTTNFNKNFFSESINIIEKYKKSEDLLFKSIFEKKIINEINSLTDEQITNLFIENVINKYNIENLDLFIIDEKNNKIYRIIPKIFSLINQGFLLSLDNKDGKGKTSKKLNCISSDGKLIDLGLRLRVHLNNGVTKLLKKDDGNSTICLKFQQDKIYKLINSENNEL